MYAVCRKRDASSPRRHPRRDQAPERPDVDPGVVRDVLVKVTGLPYASAHSRVEVRTDQTGWASVTVMPTQSLPLGQRNALVMFARARVEGQPLLAGSSTRRLVQILIR